MFGLLCRKESFPPLFLSSSWIFFILFIPFFRYEYGISWLREKERKKNNFFFPCHVPKWTMIKMLFPSYLITDDMKKELIYAVISFENCLKIFKNIFLCKLTQPFCSKQPSLLLSQLMASESSYLSILSARLNRLIVTSLLHSLPTQTLVPMFR